MATRSSFPFLRIKGTRLLLTKSGAVHVFAPLFQFITALVFCVRKKKKKKSDLMGYP